MRITNLENNSVISITVKNFKNGKFIVYEFDSVDDFRNTAKTKGESEEIIYFVSVNGTCVYSYLMFRCLANYTEGLNWGKLISLI